MKPFDLKAVVLTRHARQLLSGHFPLALICVRVAFDPPSLREAELRSASRGVLHGNCCGDLGCANYRDRPISLAIAIWE